MLRCTGFSCCGAGTLESPSSVVAAHRLSCPAACRIPVPQAGIEATSPALEGRLPITEPPGKSQSVCSRGGSEDSFEMTVMPGSWNSWRLTDPHLPPPHTSILLAWASFQHGDLTIVGLLTWQLRVPRDQGRSCQSSLKDLEPL